MSLMPCLLFRVSSMNSAILHHQCIINAFLVADTRLYTLLCRSVGRSVGPSVRPSVTIKSKSGKTRVSAPAHPSATDGRVSGLVLISEIIHLPFFRKKSKRISRKRNKTGYTATSCGRVGKGRNAHFPTFRLDGYGRTDGQTDRRTDQAS